MERRIAPALREWAFDAGHAEGAVRDLRADVGALGWDADELDRGVVRRDGAVVAVARGFLLDPLDPASALTKLSVCTERLADRAALGAFARVIDADPLRSELPIAGEVDVRWRRAYADGARAIGVHVTVVDVEASVARLRAAGYREVARDTLLVELRRDRERARFLGAGLWWQREAP